MTKPSDELLQIFEDHEEGTGYRVPYHVLKGVLRELGKLSKKTVTKTGYYACLAGKDAMDWVYESPALAVQNAVFKNKETILCEVTWTEEVE